MYHFRWTICVVLRNLLVLYRTSTVTAVFQFCEEAINDERCYLYGVSPCPAEFVDGDIDIHIFCPISKLEWHRYLKPLNVGNKGQIILHVQYHGCWWPSDARSQSLWNCGFDVISEYHGFRVECRKIKQHSWNNLLHNYWFSTSGIYSIPFCVGNLYHKTQFDSWRLVPHITYKWQCLNNA